MSMHLWKDHFKKFKDSPKSLSELLVSGELPLDDYIKWATERFKIPFLSDNFFNQTKNYKLLSENSNSEWNEYFFPVHEWQGVLYIGCLEPRNITLAKKSCFVLCSPIQLSKLWAKMQAASPKIATVNNFQNNLVLPPLTTATTHLKTQGVNMNPNFTEKNYDLVEITNVVRTPTVVSSPHSNSEFTNTKTMIPFPERTTQFTFIRTVYTNQVILEAKAKIQETTNPQDSLISAFRILKEYYNKLMWVVRDQKGLAFPIACNSAWDFTETAWNTAIDFKTPNPFRIAKLTQKPFHGSIYKNSASDDFFKLWGDGSYPNILSIVPVKLHGKIFGYFLGCEKGPHFDKIQSIELMESVTRELVENFMRIHKELAKVA